MMCVTVGLDWLRGETVKIKNNEGSQELNLSSDDERK